LFGSTFHWQIVATDKYIGQVCKLDIHIQNNIQNKWIEVAKQKNPRNVGSTDDCGTNEEECPFIVVIFQGLTFEFIYEIDKKNEKITLIDCYQFNIFHPNE